MNKTRKPRSTYPKEFKLEAIRLLDESGRPPAEIATELGIRRNQLYKWKEPLERKGAESLTSKRGRPPKQDQSELSTPRQENDVVVKYFRTN